MLDTSTSPGAASAAIRAPGDTANPDDPAVGDLALAGVDPRPDLEIELTQGLTDVPRSPDGAGRSLE